MPRFFKILKHHLKFFKKYPTKRPLHKLTELSEKQILMWFKNQRFRLKKCTNTNSN